MTDEDRIELLREYYYNPNNAEKIMTKKEWETYIMQEMESEVEKIVDYYLMELNEEYSNISYEDLEMLLDGLFEDTKKARKRLEELEEEMNEDII